jgi:periplasmic divalent cation tolerance protein
MLSGMGEHMLVVTAVDTEEKAERLARGVAGARLAASVQIDAPIRSFYWWKGELVDVREWRITMKTARGRLSEIEAYIKANHSYETPGIFATEIQWGSREYLEWISAETRSGA